MIKYPFVNSEPSTDTLTIVVDDGTNPIIGASVTIGETTGTTGVDGKAEFDLAYDDYTATITADGYNNAEKSIVFRSNHKTFTVSLTKTVNGPQDPTPSG